MCNVYAIPEATITWMHIPSNGEATVLTDSLERIDIEQNQEGYTTFSTLTFANVTFTDRGEFRCTAENEHSLINSIASLVVYGKLQNKTGSNKEFRKRLLLSLKLQCFYSCVSVYHSCA